MDLVEESSAEGMIDVLREERAGDVNLWEMQEEEEKAEEPSTPEKVDKSIDVDLDNHDLDEVRQYQFSKRKLMLTPDLIFVPKKLKCRIWGPEETDRIITPNFCSENGC